MIDIADPDAEEDRILVEMWKDSPPVQQFLIQQAVKKAGLELENQQDMALDQVMQVLPNLPPALQQAIMSLYGGPQPGQEMAPGGAPQGMPPQGGPGMPPQGAPQGMPGMPPAQEMGGMPQGQMAPGGGMPPEIQMVMEAAQQMLAQGMPPDQVAQQLIQMGVPPEIVMQVMQMLTGQGGELQNLALSAGQAGPNIAGMPQAGAEAQPNVLAQPGAPVAGPQIRPSGVATGRAPGARRQGME
jgi:hypothetical protein